MQNCYHQKWNILVYFYVASGGKCRLSWKNASEIYRFVNLPAEVLSFFPVASELWESFVWMLQKQGNGKEYGERNEVTDRTAVQVRFVLIFHFHVPRCSSPDSCFANVPSLFHKPWRHCMLTILYIYIYIYIYITDFLQTNLWKFKAIWVKNMGQMAENYTSQGKGKEKN